MLALNHLQLRIVIWNSASRHLPIAHQIQWLTGKLCSFTISKSVEQYIKETYLDKIIVWSKKYNGLYLYDGRLLSILVEVVLIMH